MCSNPEPAGVVPVPVRELLPFLRDDALAHGTTVRLTVAGGSMAPFILHGDTVELHALDGRRLRRGEVALARRGTEGGVLHRVARVNGEGVFLLGDAQGHLEGPFAHDAVIAVVTDVWHGARHRDLTRPRWRLAGLLWLALRPWRRPLARLVGTLRRALRRRGPR